MMENKAGKIKAIALLRTSVDTLISHPIIFYPFVILAFIEMVALEILYFFPRYPLNIFFAPLVERLWSKIFLHYPYNFILIPKLLYYIQIVLFMILGSFLSAIVVQFISSINSEDKITFRSAVKKNLPSYVHVLLASIVSFIAIFLVKQSFGVLVVRALKIRSTTGFFALIKTGILMGEPYFHLAIGVLISAALAFVVPIIVIEKKKIHTALVDNFVYLKDCFFLVFIIVFIPTLCYVPILILRSSLALLKTQTMPELQVLSIILSIFVAMILDTIIITATTTYYLLKREK